MKKEKAEFGRFMRDMMVDSMRTWCLWAAKDKINPIDLAIEQRKNYKLRRNRGHYTDNC